MAATLDNLRELTKCSSCNETLKEAKILKCFHTFCKNCLVIHAELKEEGKTFNCPSCQTKIDLPQSSDIDSLESSSFHSRLLEVLSIATSTEAISGVNCSVCEKPSTLHCLNCVRYICEQCLNAHNLFTEGHIILNIADIEAEDYNVFFKQQSFCEKPLHSKEFLQFYCNTCESCVCPKCILQDHEDSHDLLGIESRAEVQKLLLNDTLQKLKIKETEEQTNLKVLEEIVSNIKVTAEETKTNVLQVAEELIAFIEQNKRDLLRQVDEEAKMIIRKKTDQESLLHQTRSASEHVSKLLEYGSAHLLMTTKYSVQNRCDELLALQNDLTEIYSKITFVPSEGPTILREVGLGSLIKTKLTDPVKSTVQVESKLEALCEAKLSVFTKNSVGEPNNDPDDVIEVNISPKEDVKLLQVSERRGEKYEVEFTPKVPGQLIADVKINGKHVSNSPLVIDVKPQQLKITGQFEMKGMKVPLKRPWGIAVNKSNTRIAITDWGSHCIAVFNMEGMLLAQFGSKGSGEGQLNGPNGIAFLNDNDVVVADKYNHRLQIFNSTTGKSLKCFGRQGQASGEFLDPLGVHVDERGHIIVSDHNNNHVYVFSGDGTYQFQFSVGIEGDNLHPLSTVTHGDMFIVSQYSKHVIQVFDQQDNTQTMISVIGRQGSEDGELSNPRGLAVDNDSNLLVCDYGNHRIQKFTLDGRFVGKTCENFGQPLYIAVLAGGRIIVTDENTKRVYYME